MPVAAVIAGGAILGAGASIYSANKSSKAIQQGAAQDAALQREQNAEAARQYDQDRADLSPFREAGYTSLAQLTKGTQDGGEFNRNFTLADFQQDPGYQFRQSEGMKGLDRSASARSGVLSGGALKALDRYNQDYASNEYGAAYTRYNNDTTQRYNRLASIAGVGQTATNTGIQSGQSYIGGLQQGVNNLTASNDAAANARASSYTAAGNAIGGAVGNIGNYFALKSLLGK